MTLDHLILDVADRARSVRFYTAILGFTADGMDGPFAVIRVSADTTLLLAQRATSGGAHLAFAMSRAEFDAAFARMRDAGVPYGGSFDTVGSSTGPNAETGARGIGSALYCFDPDRHLIEIRYY